MADIADAAAELPGLGRGPGADLVLDFVGSPTTLAAAPDLLAPGGTVVVVGSGGGQVEVAKGRLANGWTVDAPFWGHRSDLVDVVALAQRGTVTAEVHTYPLADALTALDDLRAGRVQGRAVVVP